MAKKKSASAPSGKTKKMGKKTKHLLSGPRAAALKSSKPERSNPFETIWSRRKFDVLGRRPKGEERRVGLARSVAIEKRKKTLQKEYEQSGKASSFLDKRIGETDDTLQEFDKAVLRLQRERQLKLKKTSKYNLSDGEEDEFEIHQGQSLSEMDDFTEEVPFDDDDAAVIWSGNASDSSKFLNLNGEHEYSGSNLPDGEENNQKTKKQVMQEIITKSKYFKAQKAKQKEEDDHLIENLDKDFTSLAQTEALRSLTQPSKMNALKALLNKNTSSQTIKAGQYINGSSRADKESFKEDKPDNYDKLVKEMVLDIRARPSDRTKTPEEIAEEERERLELLEEERQKRMRATGDSDESSDDDEDSKISDLKLRSISGDDLGDSFSVDEGRANKKGWVDEIYEKEVDNADEDMSSDGAESEDDELEVNDSDEDNNLSETTGIEDEILSMKDWEQSDDDDLDVDAEAADALGGEKEMDVSSKSSRNIIKEDVADFHKTASGKHPMIKREALPFVIEAPKNLSELCSLLDNRSDTEAVEAINRIRACNSVKLAAENRKKMQVFYGVLLQYFAVVTTRKPLNTKILNSLVKPLIEMSVETPYFAAICARQRLIHIRTKFSEDVKISEKSSWPSLKTLLLLRLWSLIFPCSDFRHVVMTPVILLTCEYLMRCPIGSVRDIAIGAFLCSMLLSVTKQSRKFCPEALTFLRAVLFSAVDLETGIQQNSQSSFLLELNGLKPWLHISNKVCDVHPIDFFMVMDMQADSSLFVADNFKASILMSVIEILNGFIDVYEGLSSFPEIFMPYSTLLREILRRSKLPGSLQGKMEAVANLIMKKVDENQLLRQPLQMRKRKPVPIKLLNPAFEENYVKGRDYDPDRERAERKKLKKLLKSEAKGAVRELRKDNHFIYELKERDRLVQEEDRAEQYGKARAFLQEQEHAFKSGQLGKGRKRR